MLKPRSLELQSGQQSSIVVKQRMEGEVLCISGRARIDNENLGIGWHIKGGDGCILRANTRYRVTAQSRLRMQIQPKRVTGNGN
jgi:hypothetical protein